MDQQEINRICLELMAPMMRGFTKTVIEMRQQGASEADLAAMLDKVEAGNRGQVEDAILDTILGELRRLCASTRI
jgi:hypothetical protein